MAVCYFNKDYEKIFNCEYEKKNGGIEAGCSKICVLKVTMAPKSC